MELTVVVDRTLQSRRSFVAIKEVTDQLSYLVGRLTSHIAAVCPGSLSVVASFQTAMLSLVECVEDLSP